MNSTNLEVSFILTANNIRRSGRPFFTDPIVVSYATIALDHASEIQNPIEAILDKR